MTKFYTMGNQNSFKRMFAIVIAIFAIVTTASADWKVYDGSQGPTDDVFDAASSNTTTEVALSIDDAENAGNKLLQFSTVADAADKLSYSESLSDDFDVAKGFTVVMRAKATAAEHDMIELTFKSGTYYEKFRFYPDKGQLNQEKGWGSEEGVSKKINYDLPAGVSMLDWNVYRITMKDSLLNVWVNDVQIATDIKSTASSSTTKNFGFGDGNGSSTYSALIDWIIWEETGAYAPGEDAGYPEGLILSPLDGGGGDPSVWTLYDCSSGPEAWGFDPGKSDASVHVGTADIIADTENTGNNLLDMRSSTEMYWYWKSPGFTNYTKANGYTMVFRMKCPATDSSRVTEIMLYSGKNDDDSDGVWEKLRIETDGVLDFDKGGKAFDFPEGVEVTDFNVYRITFKDDSTFVWINDIPVGGVKTTSSSGTSDGKWGFGDSSSGSSYAAVFDWILVDETGAKAPDEGADYPAGLVLSPLSGGSGPGENNWEVYDASQVPVDAGFSEGRSDMVGSSTIVDDPENSGNKILDMRSAKSDYYYWKSTSHDSEVYDPAKGFTMVFRMSGVTTDSSSVGEMEVAGGGYREKIRIYGTGQVNLEKAELTFDFPEGADVMDYNVYRITFIRNIVGTDTTGLTKVWVNDVYLGEGSTSISSGSSRYQFGDSNSGKSYAALIDWIIRDVTGAYSPIENSNYPSSLVLDPLEGGVVIIPDFLRFDETSISVAQEGETKSDVALEANADWELSTEDGWITGISPIEGDSGKATFSFQAFSNDGPAPRTGKIYGLIDGEKMDSLLVTQDGVAELLEVKSVIASTEQVTETKFNYAINVNDGDVNTGWAPMNSILIGESEWIKLALKERSEVAVVKITESKTNERRTAFKVDYWDGTEYVEVLAKQLTPVQSVANAEMSFAFDAAVKTDTIMFTMYGNTSNTETDPDKAEGWFTYKELSVWGGPVTGVELVSLIDYTVYPNPTNGKFVIDNAKGADVELFNLAGKVMYQKTNISDKEQVDLDLPMGLYLLKVNQTVSKLLVK